MNSIAKSVLSAMWVLAMCNPSASAQSPSPGEDSIVAAAVGDHTISVKSAQRFMDSKLGARKLNGEALRLLKAHSLEHLVRRAIIYQYLVKTHQWAGENAIRLDIETFEQQLSRADITLEQHLAKNNISREQFEFETGWKISWQKYLEKTLTDENLDKYFQSKRRKFDGTELKVAHLLIKDTSDDSLKLIRDIRKKLESNPLEWDKLVAEHSQAVSKNEGGHIGWIAIGGPMPPEFTEAAFELDPGQISQPVQTSFGLHLIKCLEVKPGKKGPLDARRELMASAKEFLFFKLADQHREQVVVEYSGNWPRLDTEGKVVRQKSE